MCMRSAKNCTAAIIGVSTLRFVQVKDINTISYFQHGIEVSGTSELGISSTRNVGGDSLYSLVSTLQV